MTDKNAPRLQTRRARTEREILDAAWAEMSRTGVAALSVREVARSVGLRQQSLTYYFPTKQSLLDALFADGFVNLQRHFDQLPSHGDAIQGVVDVANAFVRHCAANPAAYHLMFQNTVPGFHPSDESHAIALGVLGILLQRLAALGITKPADVAMVRGVMSGLAAEQIANDPEGHLFSDQTARAIRAVLREIMVESSQPLRPRPKG